VIRIRPLINPILLQHLWQNRINAYMQDVGLQFGQQSVKTQTNKGKGRDSSRPLLMIGGFG
jgi:hypothetical protein